MSVHHHQHYSTISTATTPRSVFVYGVWPLVTRLLIHKNTLQSWLSQQSLEEVNFDWDEKTQGVVLGAFFYGYMANCFLGGRAAEYLGGRVVYGIGVVLPSFLTLFTSLCVHTSKELFIVLRVLEGLGQVSRKRKISDCTSNEVQSYVSNVC